MDIKTLIAVATGKIPHNYRNGLCPDELQPESRDQDCQACKILIEAATEHGAMEHRLREAEARVAELEAERAERAAQKPVAQIDDDECFQGPCRHATAFVPMHRGTLLYAAPPVTAPAVGYVNALRYIAWTAAGYMDCVHIAKQAIGETGALPPPPKIQPARGEG